MNAIKTLRVFVVDDDLDNAESTARLVRHLGHSSTFANSGEAALQTAPAWNPDVLILDLAMPTMDGFDPAVWLDAANCSFGLSGWQASSTSRRSRFQRIPRQAVFDSRVDRPF